MNARSHWPDRRATLPFLALAYPYAFVSFQGAPHCGPFCFAPTAGWAAAFLAGLGGVGLLALGVGARLPDGADDPLLVRRLAAPPAPAGVVLLGVFAAFVGALTLDALAAGAPAWKPAALPVSMVVFLPVWLLYVGVGLVAVLLPGLGPTPVLTLVARAVVVLVGFPLAAAFQTLLVSALVSELGSGEGTNDDASGDEAADGEGTHDETAAGDGR